MSTRRKLMLATLIVVLLQTAALAGMVARKQLTLRTGTPVVLELAEPVDPRDLFRGVYANLEFRINTLDLYHTLGSLDYKRHDPVWVVLVPPRDGQPPYWKPVSFHHALPEGLPPGAVVIRGTVARVYDHQQWRYDDVTDLRIVVTYRIENYFLPEQDANRIADLREKGVVSFKVAVDASGKAGIMAVLVDGEERYREGLW